MELFSMVSIDFTYENIHYIGYEKRSLYFNASDNTHTVQLWLYKSANDVDTRYFVVEPSDSIDTCMNAAVAIILGQ